MRTGKLSSLTRCVNKARKIIWQKRQLYRAEITSDCHTVLQSIAGIEESNKVFMQLLNSEAELVVAEEWLSKAIEQAESCI